MPRFTEESIHRLFGNEAADSEDNEQLKRYYFKSKTYQKVANDLPLRILVGHKGIGKSALFKMAMMEDESKNILTLSVQPTDLDSIAVDNADILDLIRQWRDGLQRIIAQKALVQFGIGEEGTTGTSKNLGGGVLDFLTRTFTDNRVNLSPSRAIVVDQFLKSKCITVYLDDLDRGWEGRRQDIKRISALLNAVRDLQRDSPGINVRIALRSDVFYLVRTSDESTDKIEGSVVWQSYTNHEILALLVKRVESFMGRDIDEEKLLDMKPRDLGAHLHQIFVPRFDGLGHWNDAPVHRILMSLIRKRPRDLVKLCTLAARAAYDADSEIISSNNLESVFEEYSQGRLQDTINEFRSELPDIERLLFSMKPTRKERTAKEGYYFTTDTLIKKLDNIRQSGAFVLSNGSTANSKDLIHFLYKINFLTGRKELPSGEIIRKYFEESRYISTAKADFGFSWEIHPAYRWALQPDNPRSIFDQLQLSADES